MNSVFIALAILDLIKFCGLGKLHKVVNVNQCSGTREAGAQIYYFTALSLLLPPHLPGAFVTTHSLRTTI